MSSNNLNVGNHNAPPPLSAQIPADGNQRFADLDVSGVLSDTKMLAGTLRSPKFVHKGAELTQSASNVDLNGVDNANMRPNFAQNSPSVHGTSANFTTMTEASSGFVNPVTPTAMEFVKIAPPTHEMF